MDFRQQIMEIGKNSPTYRGGRILSDRRLKNKLENTKDKNICKTKEALGKATGNEETELEGKFQSKKADLKEKFADNKEKVIKKINDALDEREEEHS